MSKRAKYDNIEYPMRDWSGEKEALWRQETSRRFHDMMDNAMMVSFYKYGAVAEGFPERLNALESLQLRLRYYVESDLKRGIAPGNVEYLVDAANFAMIEFMHPKRTDAVLIHTDADGSPGRVANNAEFYDAPVPYANAHIADADEKGL
jgi:hypothetical protein